MDRFEKINDNVSVLPRGGYLISTSIGYMQVGAPPETIKDTMVLEKGVPQIFILPGEMFDWIKGISVAEIEFPIYWNFFIQKKKTYIICHEDQFFRMKKVLQESLFGPKEFDLSRDFSNIENVPDIKKEMMFFRNNLKLSDIIAFGIFKNDKFTYKGITVRVDESGHFKIGEKENLIAEVPGKIEYKPTYDIGERLLEPYIPPLFAVTCLGPSHGFDPGNNTSGFIIWINHQGVMVDPPVNSTEWLEDSNVNPKFIDSIILTHCHADHDAGTFQKILEEGKVTIYTTETIMMSFLRKYSALSNIEIDFLSKLFEFHPIKINEPVYINGGRFEMNYTLHSIPTIGFRMKFKDQTFVYTSDHNNDPALHKELYDKKIITEKRYEELIGFPWDSDVIYHESGVPPLHTPISHLNLLSEEIQKKTIVYHIAKKDFPKENETSLTLAKFGIENTLDFPMASPEFEKAMKILGILRNVDFLASIPIFKSQEFLNIVIEEHYNKGDLIVKKGTPGDKFYIIYSGNISVDTGSGLQTKKIYGSYDYFGEVALLTKAKRAADVYAETDLVVYTIKRNKFLNFIVGTEFEKILKGLAKIRSSETWNLLSTSQFFRHCTASQKTWLESIFVPVEYNETVEIFSEGEEMNFIYLIREGEVKVHLQGTQITILKQGDYIGSMQKIYNNEKSKYTFINEEPVSLFAMKKEDILNFLKHNPGILMKSVHDF
jgi:CRP-like cAMP-binding protein/phosphoribosyl 1,2-cyclic phosphodiesterase